MRQNLSQYIGLNFPLASYTHAAATASPNWREGEIYFLLYDSLTALHRWARV